MRRIKSSAPLMIVGTFLREMRKLRKLVVEDVVMKYAINAKLLGIRENLVRKIKKIFISNGA